MGIFLFCAILGLIFGAEALFVRHVWRRDGYWIVVNFAGGVVVGMWGRTMQINGWQDPWPIAVGCSQIGFIILLWIYAFFRCMETLVRHYASNLENRGLE